MKQWIQGIDVSKHQGDVDWKKVHEAGFRFGIVKATEGADYTDPQFKNNWAKLLELDGEFYRGAYHFARPDLRTGKRGGEVEGRNFATVLMSVGGYDSGCLPPALDFEKYSPSDHVENIPWIEGFLDVVEDMLGRECMIYTGANIWRYEVGNTPKFSDYALWQVNYTMEDEPTRDMPWPWTFWQWSGGGDFAYYGRPVPGVSTKAVDINRFDGTEEDLSKLAKMKFTGEVTEDSTSRVAKFQGVLGDMFAVEEDMEDLRGMRSELVAKIQGLLLAHEYGPEGLVDAQGHPDGIAGDKTIKYFSTFKESFIGSSDTIIDSEVLVYLMMV